MNRPSVNDYQIDLAVATLGPARGKTFFRAIRKVDGVHLGDPVSIWGHERIDQALSNVDTDICNRNNAESDNE